MSRLVNTGYVVEPPAGDTPDPAAAPEVRKDGYLESLVKFIPAEAVALFLVFDNLIKSNAPEDRLVVLSIVLLFLCLALNVVYLAAAALASSRKIEANRGRSSSQRKKEAKKVWKDFWLTASVTTVAYLLWVYTLPAWIISQWSGYWELLAGVLLALFTAAVPLVNSFRAKPSA
jgi:hypothetical protein